jgi:hypothetical protein
MIGQPPGGFAGVMGQPPGGFAGRRPDYKETVPALISALSDDDGDVRKSVAAALAHIGESAVSPLLDILKDKEKGKELRANAAYVLGKIGGPARSALPALTKALKDPDRDLRRRAAFALAHIIGSDAGGFPGPSGFPPGMLPSGGRVGDTTKVDIPDPGVVAPGAKEEKPKPDGKERKTDKPSK